VGTKTQVSSRARLRVRAGVLSFSPLIKVRKLLFKTLVLRSRQHCAIGSGINQRTGWTRGVVEQRLVPACRGVVGVDRDSGGFQWALPVMVIERIEQRKVEYRRQRGILIEAYRRPCRRIFVGLRPAVRARRKPYAVGPQRVEFADPHLALLAKADGLDIGVAGQQEMRGNRFEERCAILTRVRSPHEIEQRMVVALVRTFVEDKRQRADVFGDQPHRAINDGVARIAFARKRGIVARRPPLSTAISRAAREDLDSVNRDLRRLSMSFLSPDETRAGACIGTNS